MIAHLSLLLVATPEPDEDDCKPHQVWLSQCCSAPTADGLKTALPIPPDWHVEGTGTCSRCGQLAIFTLWDLTKSPQQQQQH